MKPTIDHVILTRFNLPSRGAESLIRAREGWLRDRQELFEAYCLPSILEQTNQNFSWIIYFDPQSPQWLKDKIEDFQLKGYFVPVFREEVSSEQLLADLRMVTGGTADVLLTTNLDNDDGLALDFVERVQAAVQSRDSQAIYVSHGLIQCGERVYLRHDPLNAFCSVASSWDLPVTCWKDWHNLLGQHMSTRQVGGAPGWLQVIHDSNVSNRVRGIRVSPSAYRGQFAGGLAGVSNPNSWDLRRERLLLQPLRRMKEGARLLAKTVLMRMGGRPLLDKVKGWRQVMQ